MHIVIENKTTKESMIVDELCDYLFEDGWRYIGNVPSYAINIFEVDENTRQTSIRQYGF